MPDKYPLSRLAITDWSVNDRPREKFLSSGFSSLSDAELVAILFRVGSVEESAVDLAKRLLMLCDNSLNKLSELSVFELKKIKGIGSVKAVTLQAAFELGRRRRAEHVIEKNKIQSPADVMEYMQAYMAELKHEEFWCIFMNQASKIIKSERIGKGGITATTVDVRLVIKMAIELEATVIIVVHNHPSGEVNPSRNDISLTKQLKSAADFFNILLADHIIVSGNHYYSLHEQGHFAAF